MADDRTIRNVVIVLVRSVIGALLSFFITSYLARTLGPSNNGLYTLALLLPTMAVALGGLGLGTAAVYLLGRGLYPLAEILAKLIGASLILSALLLVAGLTLVEFFGVRWFVGIEKYILAVALSVTPLLLLYTNIVSIFHGLQEFRNHGLLTLLPAVITILLCLAGLASAEDKVVYALISWGIGYLAALLISLYFLRRGLSGFFSNLRRRSGLMTEAIAFGLRSHVGNLVAFLMYRVNFYLIGAMVGTDAVGIYAVTVPITEAIWLLANSVSVVIFPLVASQIASEKKDVNITPSICRCVLVISILMGITVAALASIIVDLAFGAAYASAATALYWLLPGVVVFTVTKILSNDIAGRGRPEINLYVVTLSLAVNLLLNYLLLPRYGLNGAAMAASLTYFAYTLVITFTYSKLVGVKIVDCLIPQHNDWIVIKRICKAKLMAS